LPQSIFVFASKSKKTFSKNLIFFNMVYKSFYIACVLILATVANTFAQQTVDKEQKNLIKTGIIGIYAGPYFRYTKVDGNWTDISGGGGGIYIKKRFFIAGSSFGQWNPGKSATFADKLIRLSMNGVTLGVNSNPNRIVHFNAELFAGAGNATLLDMETKQETNSMNLKFIAPMLDMEINVYEGFRFFIGADYRFAFSNGAITGLSAQKFSGFSVFWGIKTGLF
jgi:hypothetical protein